MPAIDKSCSALPGLFADFESGFAFAQEAGHAANVTSYFDRFWENGNKRERYFIHVRKWTIE